MQIKQNNRLDLPFNEKKMFSFSFISKIYKIKQKPTFLQRVGIYEVMNDDICQIHRKLLTGVIVNTT